MSALPQSPVPFASPALRLTRNEAQARTTIAQRAAGLPLPMGQVLWSARFTPVVHASALPEACHLIRLEWAGAAFALRLPSQAVEQLVSASLDGASLPALPPALADAALEAAMRSLLQSLQHLGRGTPALVSVSAEQNGPVPAHAFDLHLRSTQGDEAIAGTLHTDGLGLLLVAGLLNARPPVATQVQPDVPLALHAEIGFTRLAANELAQLAIGDVVLVEACFASADRVLWLSADGRAGLHAQLAAIHEGDDQAAPPCLTIIQPWTSQMPTDISSHQEGAAPAEADTATLASLPVRLSFDLGDVQLTLAQVQSLQAGQTLDLARPIAGAVRIRANGALIGEGDLVEIDGQIGVSVARIFGQAH